MKERRAFDNLVTKVRSGYIPAYVSEDSPWFAKFNGINPAWHFLDAFSQVNYAFYQIYKDLGLFPMEIADRILEWLDFRRSTRIAARLSMKMDRRRLELVLEKAERVFPMPRWAELWLPPALD